MREKLLHKEKKEIWGKGKAKEYIGKNTQTIKIAEDDS